MNNALTRDQRRELGISESWRTRIAHANSMNDATMIDANDAGDLAEIVIFGGKVTYD